MEQIRVEHISYSYQNQYQKIEAVKDISCGFEAGNLYAIVGESGSGKSTFLSLLAGLDTPDSGRVLIEGKDLAAMDRDAYRRKQAAVVYQAFHLLPLLTALENVMYPLELQGISRKEAMQRAVKSGSENFPPVSENDEWRGAAAGCDRAGNGSGRKYPAG